MSNIYLYSDPHFCHANVIKFCERPFRDVQHMNEEMIRLYNSVVGPDDICIWVGDCFWKAGKSSKEIMSRLNGKKILVLGNHDKGMEGMMNMGFDWACYEMKLHIAGEVVQIKHYPFRPPWWKRVWNKLLGRKTKYLERRPVNRGQWLIHGHTHSPEKFRGKAIHVGVDAWKYKPVSINVIAKYIKNYNG